MTNPHERGPLRDQEIPADVRARLDALLTSEYMGYVMALRSLVAGRTVTGSAAGHSGFTVELDDHTYVVAYLDRDRLCWKHGPGVPTAADFRLIASPEHGDAGEPLTTDRPYATESCDIAAEVARAHGQRIETLSIGENTFNLAFGDGHELDTMLVTAKDGRQGLRVFWEQW